MLQGCNEEIPSILWHYCSLQQLRDVQGEWAVVSCVFFISRREGAKHNKKVVLDLLRQRREKKKLKDEAADCNSFHHLLFIFGCVASSSVKHVKVCYKTAAIIDNFWIELGNEVMIVEFMQKFNLFSFVVRMPRKISDFNYEIRDIEQTFFWVHVEINYWWGKQFEIIKKMK